jgi:hypothetical protein
MMQGPLFDELWVDGNQSSAICRYVNFNGSNPWLRFDIKWTKRAFSWWPQEWTLTWTRHHKVCRVHRLQVETFEPNPEVEDSYFTFEIKPGMKVRVAEAPPPESGLDPRHPASKMYVVSPSGSWEQLWAKGFTTTDGKLLPPERGSLWYYFAIAGGIALAALAYVMRRSKARAQT